MLTDLEIQNAFLFLLGRRPSDGECQDWKNACDDVDGLRAGLKQTDEWIQSTLAELSTVGKKDHLGIFFCHIPRAGGTLLDQLFREAKGIPPLSLSPALLRKMKSIHGSQAKEALLKWTYLKGHTSVFWAPKGFKVVSNWRDPFSRFISEYVWLASSRVRSFVRASSHAEDLYLPWPIWFDSFEEYVDRKFERMREGTVAWQFSIETADIESFMKLSQPEKKDSIVRGLEMVDAMGNFNVLSSYLQVAELPTTFPLTRENHVRGTSEVRPNSAQVGPETTEKLESLLSWDLWVENQAMRQDLLPKRQEEVTHPYLNELFAQHGISLPDSFADRVLGAAEKI